MDLIDRAGFAETSGRQWRVVSHGRDIDGTPCYDRELVKAQTVYEGGGGALVFKDMDDRLIKAFSAGTWIEVTKA